MPLAAARCSPDPGKCSTAQRVHFQTCIDFTVFVAFSLFCAMAAGLLVPFAGRPEDFDNDREDSGEFQYFDSIDIVRGVRDDMSSQAIPFASHNMRTKTPSRQKKTAIKFQALSSKMGTSFCDTRFCKLCHATCASLCASRGTNQKKHRAYSI